MSDRYRLAADARRDLLRGMAVGSRRTDLAAARMWATAARLTRLCQGVRDGR